MLMRRLILKEKLSRYVCVATHVKHYFYSTKCEINPIVVELPEFRLSEHAKKIKKREPFVKNFFCGKYDTEFAAFPEPQTHERHGEFFKWLKPIEDYVESSIDGAAIDKNGEIPLEVINQLKALGIFRAAVPDEYNGLGLNTSEYGKLIETLSYVPSLGAYFAKRLEPIKFITNYASDVQKSMYLPEIANGNCIPTICISEDVHGSEGTAVLTQATLSDCEKYWILNGTKTYVTNGDNANLFIVFAECKEVGHAFASQDSITAFLVERSNEAMTIGPPIKTMGFRGLSLCEIKFRNTKIPAENIIGEIGGASILFSSVFSNCRESAGAQAIGITKRFLELIVKYLKSNNDFNATQFKDDTIQEVIGKICCSIYGMESVLYLTTGMMDTVMDQDCDLERCIVESYCIDTCIQCLIMSTHVLGMISQVEGPGIEQLIRDAVSLISIDGTKTNIETVIALLGMQHLGNHISSEIKKLRNPWSHPMEALKNALFTKKYEKLYIADYLHPSLRVTADLIEQGINNLKNAIHTIVTRHGRRIDEKQIDLRRVSDAVSYLYVISAVVARASRSYCLGMRDSEKEVKMAQVFGYVLYQKVKELIEELNDGNYVNGDIIIKQIADSAFENNAYFVEHPLARNF